MPNESARCIPNRTQTSGLFLAVPVGEPGSARGGPEGSSLRRCCGVDPALRPRMLVEGCGSPPSGFKGNRSAVDGGYPERSAPWVMARRVSGSVGDGKATSWTWRPEAGG